MIRSMTGFGNAEYLTDKRKYIVEIKSVNNKYFDFSMKSAKFFTCFEEDVKKCVSSKVNRGKIELVIHFENFSPIGKNIRFDDELLIPYLQECKRVSEMFNIENNIKMSDLINIENLIRLEKDASEDEIIKQELVTAVTMAVSKFADMRIAEGEKISININEKIQNLNDNIQKIEKISFNVVDEFKNKIENRLHEYIEKNNIDNNRILTEIVIFADKMTIDEEIIRFRSHLGQLKKEMNNRLSSGKKIEFIVQELNRETNTIGSKTNNLEITNLVIENKAILENIREQIQNIE